jgi:hypothetical protein
MIVENIMSAESKLIVNEGGANLLIAGVDQSFTLIFILCQS